MSSSVRPPSRFVLNDSGASVILVVAILFSLLGVAITMFQSSIVARAAYQQRIKKAYLTQLVLEELAKYMQASRDVARQVNGPPTGPCPAGTNDSNLVPTAGYGTGVPGVDPGAYPLRICWVPPTGPGAPANCLGIQYLGNYYCLTNGHLHAAERQPGDTKYAEEELRTLSRELQSRNRLSGFGARKFHIINPAYADWEPQWPVNNGVPVPGTGVKSAALTQPGSSQGYNDNHCGTSNTDQYRCINLSICQANHSGPPTPPCVPAGGQPSQMWVRLTELDPLP